jgi:hypothetical protein
MEQENLVPKPNLALFVLVAAIVLLSSAAGCGPSTADSKHGAKSAVPAPTTTPEWTEFAEPIMLVEANGYMDGGTTYVCLRDARGRHLWAIVSTKFDDGPVPPHTLFLDAKHYMDASARLPMSTKEAELVVTSLEKSVAATLSPEQREVLEKNGEIQDDDPDKLTKVFAFDALQRVRKHAAHPTLDASGSNPPPWYKYYIWDRDGPPDSRQAPVGKSDQSQSPSP